MAHRPRGGVERLAVTLVLWLLLLALWWQLAAWHTEGLRQAHARGIMVEPSELIVTLPIWFLGVAHHLAPPLARRLKRYWNTRGW